MLAAPVESAPVEEPPKAPTPPPPAGNFNNYPLTEICVSNQKIVNYLLEATYNAHTIDDQYFLYFSLFLVDPHLNLSPSFSPHQCSPERHCR